MSVDPQTRQQLLELVYDLLPEGEAAALRARLASDAALRDVYAEVQATAQVFARASLHKAPALDLRRLAETSAASRNESGGPVALAPRTAPTPPARPRRAPRVTGEDRSYWARNASWTVGLAAGLLLAVSLGGYFYHRQQFAELAAAHLRLLVTGPAHVQAAAANTYTVNTSLVTGAPVRTQIEFAVYSPSGKAVLRQQEATDARGILQLAIPPDVFLAPGSRLEISAQQQQNRQQVAVPLQVEPVRYAAHLSVDRAQYAPGETVYYRSLGLAWFTLKADRELPVEYLIRDPRGKTIAGSTARSQPQQGVGSGSFVIPADAAEGAYQVVVRSVDQAFAETTAPFEVVAPRGRLLRADVELTRSRYAPGERVVALLSARRVGGEPARGARLNVRAEVDGQTVFEAAPELRADAERVEFTLPKNIARGAAQLIVSVQDGEARDRMLRVIPVHLERVEVNFYPEGGALAAELSNRVYLSARDPRGNPVAIRGHLVNAKNEELAHVETNPRGLGMFTLTPDVNEAYRLKIVEPTGITSEPACPLADAKQKVLLQTGAGVFEAGQPVEFDIAALQTQRPLVVRASCRGVSVGHWTGITASGQRPLHGALPLAAGVGGVIRLTAYDFGVQPPRPVAERLVYRRPERRLALQFVEPPFCVSGDVYHLTVQAQNEKATGAAGADMSVAVVAAPRGASAARPASMPAAFLLTSELENPREVTDADAYLAETPAAAVALDQLLGTQSGPTSSGQLAGSPGGPPLVFDNLSQIRANYDRSLQAFHTERAQRFHALTTLSFFGGFALVLFVGMLTIVKIISGIRLWVPALGAALCCLVVGAALMNPDRLQPGMDSAVAFLPYHPTVAEVAQLAKSDRAESRDRNPLAGKLAVVAPAPAAMPAELERKAPPPASAARQPAASAPAKKARGGLAGTVSTPGKEKAAAKRETASAVASKPATLDMATQAPPASAAAESPQLKSARTTEPARQFAYSRAAGEERDGARTQLARRADDAPAGAAVQQNAPRQMQSNMDAAAANVANFRNRAQLNERFSQMIVAPATPNSGGVSLGVESAPAEPAPVPLLLWNPQLKTNAAGQAGLDFDIPAAGGETYLVSADGHLAGRIGHAEIVLTSAAPCQFAATVPALLTTGDRMRLPARLHNPTRRPLPVELRVETAGGLKLQGSAAHNWSLAAGGEQRELLVVDAPGMPSAAELSFQITAGGVTQALRHFLQIDAPGTPGNRGLSGQLEGEQTVSVDVPQPMVADSLRATLRVFPKSLADLQYTRAALVAAYPLGFPAAAAAAHLAALAVEDLESGAAADPTVVRQWKDALAESRARWKNCESPLGGYDWWASPAGDEVLSAYGLMVLAETRRASFVEPAELERLTRWLLTRRDAQGRFAQHEKIPAALRAPAEWTDAYVCWALALAGQKGLEADWKRLAATGGKTDDPLVTALAAVGLQAAGLRDQAQPLLDKLATSQQTDGSVSARASVPGAKVQCTALAVWAWLKSPAHAARAKPAVQWLAQGRTAPGGFGPPQVTSLALKALVEYDRTQRRSVREGQLIVRREGTVLGQHEIAAGRQETVVLTGLEKSLLPGANRLTLTLGGGNRMAYALELNYCTAGAAARQGPLELRVQLDQPVAKLGQTVRLTATLTNTSDAIVPLPTATLALPAGVEASAEQLRKLKQAGTLGDFELLRPRAVVCAWRAIEPRAKITLTLELTAALPGKYTSGVARAGVLNNPDVAAWAESLLLETTPE